MAVPTSPKKTSEPTPTPIITSPRPKIEFDWVTIPAGEFWMGSDDGPDNEKPMHKVYLPEYQIARVPITNEQWGIFLQNSGYNWAKRNELWKNGLPLGKEKHPVVWVNWHDSMAFCKWAGVRLPTEAEWEKAARGTDDPKYPWGNQDKRTLDRLQYNEIILNRAIERGASADEMEQLVDNAWRDYDDAKMGRDTSEPTVSLHNFNSNVGDTTSVGNYPSGKSPYGCLDMVGNVWEWCSSEYKAYPYKAADGREDVIITSNLKVLRGGSWSRNGSNTRVTTRDYVATMYWAYYFGSRCVR